MDVSSEGEAITDDSSGMSALNWSILLIIPLAIIVGLVIFLRKRREHSIPSSAPAQGAFAAPLPQPNATPCFACRQPILSMMQGCPSCGARYHSTCKVVTCVNCGANSTTFVNVE